MLRRRRVRADYLSVRLVWRRADRVPVSRGVICPLLSGRPRRGKQRVFPSGGFPAPSPGEAYAAPGVGFHPMAGQGGSRMIARFIPHHDYLRIGHGFIDRIATSGCPPRRSTRGLRPGAKLAQSALLVSSRRRNSWSIQEPYGWSGIGPSFAGGQERARIQSFIRVFSHSGRVSSR